MKHSKMLQVTADSSFRKLFEMAQENEAVLFLNRLIPNESNKITSIQSKAENEEKPSQLFVTATTSNGSVLSLRLEFGHIPSMLRDIQSRFAAALERPTTATALEALYTAHLHNLSEEMVVLTLPCYQEIKNGLHMLTLRKTV